MDQHLSTRECGVLLTVISVAAAVYWIDLSTEAGVACGSGYVAVMWLVFRSEIRWAIPTTAVICTVLTIVGAVASPVGDEIWKTAMNRALSIAVIWLMAELGVRVKQYHESLARQTAASAEFAAIVHASDDAIVGTTLDGVITRRVVERTEELAAANTALAHSNIELQQFAYVASHDLQTPLRGIAGFAQFLHEDYSQQLDDRAKEYTGRIVEGVARMQRLITDLLAYSRVDSGANSCSEVDLNETFDDAAMLLSASIDELGAEVTRDALPTVRGDGAQLSQLLQNLIGNGIKYCSEVTPRVHLSAEPLGSGWQIAVRDNGIGISEKDHPKIFEIFRRLHSQLDYPGTGIGLAVCRRIVLRHGGEIWLESEVGAGSCFYFTVPGDCELEQSAPVQALETVAMALQSSQDDAAATRTSVMPAHAPQPPRIRESSPKVLANPPSFII
ncbi:ATP-binding protein [Pirellulales bacterium]|nr:ATP-binding protein [Pirellulales bacterium]